MFVKIEGSLVNFDLVYNIDLNDDGTATLWFIGTAGACRDVTADDMKAIEAAIRHEYVVEDIESPASTFSGVNLEDIKNLSGACECLQKAEESKWK